MNWNTKHRAFISLSRFFCCVAPAIPTNSIINSLKRHSESTLRFYCAQIQFVSSKLNRIWFFVYSLCLLFCVCHPFWMRSKFYLFLCTWFKIWLFVVFFTFVHSVFFLHLSIPSLAHCALSLSVCVCVFLFRMVANLMFNYYEVCVLRYFFTWQFRQSHGICLSAKH